MDTCQSSCPLSDVDYPHSCKNTHTLTEGEKMTHLSETCRSWLILIVGGLEGRGTYSCRPVGSGRIICLIYLHTCICEKRKSSAVVRCHQDKINPPFTIIE